MPVRIRLQRHGKKGKPFYWIVAADGRAKRDGRYLEKIGTYNPNTNPASVELDVDQAVKWLENGAQPSDTARTLLSYRGAMMKHHLNGGVKKGAFSQEEADKRFATWLEEKQAKIQMKIDGLDKDKATDLAQRLEAEKAVNQKRIADLSAAAKVEETTEGEATEATAEASIEEAEPEATEVVQKEASADEIAEETPAVEEAKVEETAAEETAEEVSASEEPKAEEAPTEEVKNEETPAKEEKDKVEETPAKETMEEASASEEPKAEEAPT
ncbi:MAG: 30S ribosomal protein S16, partial [Flavobacteriaceae bacterium]|nr:30S ribosomal protein S16 [Flavobacteriaceae bacterium]